MKTTWANETVARKHFDWINAKRRDFENTFKGTHWVAYHSHGKLHFHPTWRECNPDVDLSPQCPSYWAMVALYNDIEMQILEMLARTDHCYEGVTFVQMYESLKHKTGYNLYRILCVCLHIAREHPRLATSIIGRTGDAMGLRRLS